MTPARTSYLQAAEKEVEMMMGVFATRGCKEDLIPDPELLNEGKVAFPSQAATDMTPSEIFQHSIVLPCKVIQNVLRPGETWERHFGGM